MSVSTIVRRCVLLGLILAVPAGARANGAFPDSSQLFAPAGRPEAIVLGTNFGLITSDDHGATWTWICEQAIDTLPYLYLVGPAPSHLLYAINGEHLNVSRDGCAWVRAGGLLASGAEVGDVFADPSDGDHVLALARLTTTTSLSYGLFESRDGGFTFPTMLRQSPLGAWYPSVEIASADPSVVYMTMAIGTSSPEIFLLRSRDGARTWTSADVTRAVEGRVLRIAAVDPIDPRTLYLRAFRRSPDEGDALAISRDGGETVAIVHRLATRMSSFLRRDDGALIIGTFEGGLISTDDGARFEPWAGAPRLRALAARDGVIYAAADDVTDGFAVAETASGGSWSPLFAFADIAGVRRCPEVERACAGPWADQMLLFGIGGGATDAGVEAPLPAPSACGCSASSQSSSGSRGSRAPSPAALGALALALALRGVRRRRTT